MGDISRWVLGFCALVLAIGALFVASHAGEGIGYYGGIAMFTLCVMFIYHLMRTAGRHG